MSVDTTNSNLLPMTLQGVSVQSPVPPSSILAGTAATKGISPQGITAPVQVIGLVPVFSCCQNKCTIFWTNTDTANVVTFTITFGLNTTASFSSTGTDTTNMVAAEAQAILPSGLTCAASFVQYSGYKLWTVTIYAPVGSSTYNGMTVTLNMIAGTDVFGDTDFSNLAGCDCRQGIYGADAIPDDTNITMPVFADPTAVAGSYTADTNSWLFSYPGSYNAITSGDFKLQQYSGGVWSNIATLSGSTYGTPYHSACTNINYSGFTLDWTKVYNHFGAGTYRFNVTGHISKSYQYCFSTPAFCLQLYSCTGVDSTVRFDASYTGGNFGSATTQGISWALCCATGRADGSASAIAWADSIRYYGFFGFTNYDKVIDTIKYQSGVIAKIRDEVIKKFTLKLGAGTDKNWPQWMIERFASYGMEADKLLVNDYNINNPQYSFKKYWVVGDGNVAPDYKGSSRYMKVKEIAFKEGQQYIFRDRCCS